MAVEAAQYHRPRLGRYPEDYLPCISKLLGEGLACAPEEYARCKEHQKAISREMEKCFDGVDVLLAPATTGPAPSAATTGNPLFNAPWSYTGLPSVSLPAGQAADGMPIAIQLIGGRWGEAELLRAGNWCETILQSMAK
jgi:aspartyl-tRNA(Asn)/glutamyl-tRNA(Gln) amidotransferase subunit A